MSFRRGIQTVTARCLLTLLALVRTASGQHPILEGVTNLSLIGGTQSPIIADDPAWVPLVAGGNALAGPPPLVAAARAWGDGRIVFSCREWHTNEASNATFRLNAATWLANGRSGALAWTTGHGEWHTFMTAAVLPSMADAMGRSSFAIPGTVSAASLSGVAVLYVLDPWAYFSESERSTIMGWVHDGGGLYVCALGWSWDQYHPGFRAEIDHPATRLLAGTRAFPVNSYVWWYQGQPQTFGRLGDAADTGCALFAFGRLVALHQAHGPALPAVLEQDSNARRVFSEAHAVLSYASLLGLPSPHREDALLYARELLLEHSFGLYARGAPLPSSVPNMIRGRERIWRTLADLTPQDPAARAELGELAGWTGARLALYRDHGVLVVDNDRTSPAQLGALRDAVASIPSGRIDLDAITINEFLPPGSPDWNLGGRGCQVNVFGTAVGTAVENSFPSDGVARPVDLFLLVAAHEVTHALDATWVTPTHSLSMRRAALIEDAGSDPLNYLRSTLPNGYFVQNPQEFLASIGNQWASESSLCFRLGRTRLEAGRRQPIEQALFMAELYSVAGKNDESTTFFRGHPDGTLVPRNVAVRRDPLGRISEVRDGTAIWLIIYGPDHHVQTVFEFSLDCNANGIADAHEILVTRTASDHDSDMIPDACQCPADLNRDGIVDSTDLSGVLAAWGTAGGGGGGIFDADLDDDQTVSSDDLAILLASWGPCPPADG